MNIKFYILPNAVGLKFDQSTDRDSFWNGLPTRNGFKAQEAAERIGQRTIRFYPAKMKEGFEWSLMTLPNVVAPPVLVPTVVAPAPISQAVRMQQAKQAATPETMTTVHPFASVATNPTRTLPGLCPPPPAELLAVTEPAPTLLKTESMGVVALYPIAPAPAAAEEVSPPVSEPSAATPDPAPPDKRTKAWREWKARQV